MAFLLKGHKRTPVFNVLDEPFLACESLQFITQKSKNMIGPGAASRALDNDSHRM